MTDWNDPQWDKFFAAVEEPIKGDGDAAVPDALSIARRELSEEWTQATKCMNENDVDGVAEVLRSAYRRCMRKKYCYPWRWFSEQRLKDMNRRGSNGRLPINFGCKKPGRELPEKKTTNTRSPKVMARN